MPRARPHASSPSPASTITLQPVAGHPPPEPTEQERELEGLRADNIHLSKNVEQAGIKGAPCTQCIHSRPPMYATRRA